MRTKLIKIFFTSLLCLGFVIFFSGPNITHAQSQLVSEAEKVVFAYFKLARKTPNYARWIEAFSKYRDKDSMHGKQQFYEQESLRLKWGFGTYDYEETPIKIKTDIQLQFRTDQADPTLNFRFLGGTQESTPFFPYPYGGEWIALVVQKLKNFTTIKLLNDEYAHINAQLKPGKIYEGRLHMRVKPTSVDDKAPLSIEGQNNWLMMGSVAFLELIYEDPASGEEITLWEFTAPWYLTDTEKALLPLLED